jgi:hypothetical protein
VRNRGITRAWLHGSPVNSAGILRTLAAPRELYSPRYLWRFRHDRGRAKATALGAVESSLLSIKRRREFSRCTFRLIRMTALLPSKPLHKPASSHGRSARSRYYHKMQLEYQVY